MKTMSMSALWLRMRGSVARMLDDCSGIAATEFAVIVPIMLAMFFGTVEIYSVSRSIAASVADLTSQSSSAVETQFGILAGMTVLQWVHGIVPDFPGCAVGASTP